MKRFSTAALIAVLAITPATIAFAQTSSTVVSKLEVQRLVAEGTPEANASLASHFDGLAARYEADAKRYKAVAQGYVAYPTRGAGSGAKSHFERLAALAAESARNAREMAAYHRQLAAGKTGPAPKGAGAFDSGTGAPEPTADELKQLAASAKSATDHRRLEEYYLTVAKKYTADAESHQAMAQAYRAGVRKGTFDPATHCDRLMTLSRNAAKEANEAASLHHQLASAA